MQYFVLYYVQIPYSIVHVLYSSAYMYSRLFYQYSMGEYLIKFINRRVNTFIASVIGLTVSSGMCLE